MTSAQHRGAYGKQIGDQNRSAIEAALKNYPGIRNREIAEKLNIRVETVGKHVMRIRKTWQ